MAKLTREEFDECYEWFMTNFIQIISNRGVRISINPRGHISVDKRDNNLYLGTSQEAAISAYNKALDEVNGQ